MSNDNKYFEYKARKGLDKRLSSLSYVTNESIYRERLEYEIGVIEKMGFVGYFLVVADFIQWAKSKGIYVGEGRGSGAGSLVAYSLEITNVDPILYDLYFERFINPSRISMPDFDTDFQKSRHGEVIEYVRNKYGTERVCQIGTFGTFKGKKAMKDVARTLGYDLSLGVKLSKLFLKPQHGKEAKLKDAIKYVPEYIEWYADENSDEGKVLRWAEQIEDRQSSFGVHAAGVIISNEPLTKTIPLAKGKNDEVVSQWDMGIVEEVGLIKYDFLGLKTLDLVATTIDLVKQTKGIVIDLESIPRDDDETYALLRRGDNLGIFQIEASSGIRDLTVKVKPETIEDLAVVMAAYRPGPLGSDQMSTYLNWRAGHGKPTYHHPDLESILKETGGWLIYQESVLRIARDMAGYTLAEADLLRRAIGKKKEKEMIEQKEKFSSGMKKNGYSESLANTLWDEILAFAAYGFNKSHAVAYALLAYKTAYLKAHYPVEFMAAALTCDSRKQDQVIVYLQECKRMGIPVLPPDINESGLDFTPVGNTIRFGLFAIKNVGEAARIIIEERENRGPFKSLFEFAERIDLSAVNIRKIDSLVSAGAFDCLRQNRATLLLASQQAINYKDEYKKYLSKLETYERKLKDCEEREEQIKAGMLSPKGKKLNSLSVPQAPILPVKPEYIVVPEMDKAEILNLEKELTGSFISGHPLHGINGKNISTIQSLKEDEDQTERVTLLCVLSQIDVRENKQKKRYAQVVLEDLTATVQGVIFTSVYDKCIAAIQKNVPVYVHAAVTYEEVENEDGDVELIPSIRVQKVERATADIVKKESELELDLSIKNIATLKRCVDKVKAGSDMVRLKFNTKSGTCFIPMELVGVDDERKLRALLYPQLSK